MAIAIGQKRLDGNAFGGNVTTTGINTQASGSSFIAFATYGAGNFTSIADNKGNTWTLIDTPPDVFGADRGRWYMALNGTGGSGHTLTINSSGSSVVAGLLEITHPGTLSMFGSFAVEDTSSPYTTSSISPGSVDTLLVTWFYAFSGDNPATNTEGGLTGSTVQLDQTDGSNLRAQALATAAVNGGTHTPSWTQSSYTANAGVFFAAFQDTGGGAITGSISLSVSPAGALTGTGALAGSVAVTVAPSGALTGAGALAGSVPLSFVPAGILTGAGAIAGSIPVSISVSGALSGASPGDIAGSVSMALTPTGTLTGAGALDGLVMLDLGVSGLFAQPITASADYSGGFLFAYELEQAHRRRKRAEQEERKADASHLMDKVDREIALLLQKQEAEDEQRAELDRLKGLVSAHSREQLELSDRAKIAFTRALAQANFSALEALDRELQRQLEEEDTAVLMLLLNSP